MTFLLWANTLSALSAWKKPAWEEPGDGSGVRRRLLRNDGCDGLRHRLELTGVRLEFVRVACAKPGLHVGDGFRSGCLVVYDFLGDGFEVDQHLRNVLGDDGQILDDGEERVEDLVGGSGIFYGECVKRADGGSQFERDLLNGVDHLLVLFDDLRNVVDGACQFI